MARYKHKQVTHGSVDEAMEKNRESPAPAGHKAVGQIATTMAAELCKAISAQGVSIVAVQGENATCVHYGDVTPMVVKTLRELADDLEEQLQ